MKYIYQIGHKIYQIGHKMYQIDHKIYQMAILKYTKLKPIKRQLNMPNFPFSGLPKYTKIGIFGMQIYHLATL
jgi:hypothetical protein